MPPKGHIIVYTFRAYSFGLQGSSGDSLRLQGLGLLPQEARESQKVKLSDYD